MYLSINVLFVCIASVAATPVEMDESAAELITLRQSIQRLRDTLGETVVAPIDPSVQAFTYDVETTMNKRKQPPPFEGILNIKAGLRTMPTSKESMKQEEDIGEGEGEELEAMADRSSRYRQNRRRHRGRHGRRRRKKGCPTNKDGRKQIMCPSKSIRDYDVCITANQLCDGIEHCPRAEDEHPTNCLFYRTTKEHLKQVYNTVVALADHVVKSDDRRRQEL